MDAGKLASSPRFADLCFVKYYSARVGSAASHISVPQSIDPVPLPHVYKGASFSERVRSAWRVSLARSLSYTRLRVSPVGQGKNAGLPRRVGLMVEGWGRWPQGLR